MEEMIKCFKILSVLNSMRNFCFIRLNHLMPKVSKIYRFNIPVGLFDPEGVAEDDVIFGFYKPFIPSG